MIAYWKGEYLPAEDITVSAFDLGVLRGYGVFDVMRTEHGKPYNLEKHWERFLRSATALNLTIPVTAEEFKTIITTLAEKNGATKDKELNFRAVLTGGPATDAFHPEPGKETFFVLTTPFVRLPESAYTQGSKVITLEHQRELAGAKITNYTKAIQHRQVKKESEALEILFVKEGRVKEASTSNFFAVINGVLVTAKDDVLLGTTRNLILKLAQENNIPFEERDPSLEEVLAGEEAFIAAVNKYIVPVTLINETVIGTGKPGAITEQLRSLLRESIQKDQEN